MTYTERFGKGAYITKATAQLMRDLGSIPSPHNAFLLGIGLETLFLRVQRHCENAQKVAEFLEENEKVAWVNYPVFRATRVLRSRRNICRTARAAWSPSA